MLVSQKLLKFYNDTHILLYLYMLYCRLVLSIKNNLCGGVWGKKRE